MPSRAKSDALPFTGLWATRRGSTVRAALKGWEAIYQLAKEGASLKRAAQPSVTGRRYLESLETALVQAGSLDPVALLFGDHTPRLQEHRAKIEAIRVAQGTIVQACKKRKGAQKKLAAKAEAKYCHEDGAGVGLFCSEEYLQKAGDRRKFRSELVESASVVRFANSILPTLREPLEDLSRAMGMASVIPAYFWPVAAYNLAQWKTVALSELWRSKLGPRVGA